jgi:hypothetical protein
MGGTASLKVAGTGPVAAVITRSAPQEFGVSVSDADLSSDRAPTLFVNSEGDTYASDTVRMCGLAIRPSRLTCIPGPDTALLSSTAPTPVTCRSESSAS